MKTDHIHTYLTHIVLYTLRTRLMCCIPIHARMVQVVCTYSWGMYVPLVHTHEIWPQGITYTRGIAPGHNSSTYMWGMAPGYYRAWQRYCMCGSHPQILLSSPEWAKCTCTSAVWLICDVPCTLDWYWAEIHTGTGPGPKLVHPSSCLHLYCSYSS